MAYPVENLLRRPVEFIPAGCSSPLHWAWF
jgi:hypothetical protein